MHTTRPSISMPPRTFPWTKQKRQRWTIVRIPIWWSRNAFFNRRLQIVKDLTVVVSHKYADSVQAISRIKQNHRMRRDAVNLFSVIRHPKTWTNLIVSLTWIVTMSSRHSWTRDRAPKAEDQSHKEVPDKHYRLNATHQKVTKSQNRHKTIR